MIKWIFFCVFSILDNSATVSVHESVSITPLRVRRCLFSCLVSLVFFALFLFFSSETIFGRKAPIFVLSLSSEGDSKRLDWDKRKRIATGRKRDKKALWSRIEKNT